MFESVEDVQNQFRQARYITSRTIATVVYLAAEMKKPIPLVRVRRAWARRSSRRS